MIMKSSSRLDELLTPSPSRARAWALPKKSSLEPTKKPEPRAEPEPSLGSDPSLSCMMELNKYPLDVQVCRMEIASCELTT